MVLLPDATMAFQQSCLQQGLCVGAKGWKSERVLEQVRRSVRAQACGWEQRCGQCRRVLNPCPHVNHHTLPPHLT